MKRCILFVACFSLFFSVFFGQVAQDIAVPYIESKGILSDCTADPMTYEEFYTAVEVAFPEAEIPFEAGPEQVLRKDFIANVLKILDLEDEALKFEDAYTWANDERIIPDAYLPQFTLAYQSNRQLLDYRYGQLAAPFKAITKIEAARSFYSAIFPPEQGGQVVTAVTADPPGFNTLFTSSGLTWTLCNILGDGYLGTNEDGFYIPRMIKEIPTVENGLIQMLDNGGMAITYNVRKGMKWHDGVEITAHDAAFQWEVMVSNAPVASNYFERMVKKVEVHDDYSFTIYFDQPMADGKFGSSVYGYYFGWFQLPEHVYREPFEEAKASGKWDAFANDITRNPVLSGPYKLKEYKEGQHVVLEAFDEYYMGRPNIDTVIFRIIPDSDSIFASTLNGEIDVGRYTLDLKQSLQLRNQKSDMFNVFLTPNVAYRCIDLNFRDPEDLTKPNPLFGDIRTRQAFLYGLNREQINNIVFQGEAEIVDTWITELHMMREALKAPAIKHYEYNPTKAKQLMEEAGWKMNKNGYYEKDGEIFEFKLIGAAGSTETEILSQLIQGMLKAIGMKVNIDLKPSLVLWTEVMPYGNFDALLTGWGYGINDEASNYWGSNNIPSEANGFGGTNYTGWSNARNDEILDELTRTMAAEKKLELYTEHFKIWTEELPVIPLMADPTPHFAKKYIRSFSSTYDGGLGWVIQNWYIEK